MGLPVCGCVVKQEMLSEVKVMLYVCIDGVFWAVPENANYVFQCHRGFWFTKERKPEVVKFVKTRTNEWTPEKELLHTRDESGRLVPLRTEPSLDWEKRVFLSVSCLPSGLSNAPMIECE